MNEKAETVPDPDARPDGGDAMPEAGDARPDGGDAMPEAGDAMPDAGPDAVGGAGPVGDPSGLSGPAPAAVDREDREGVPVVDPGVGPWEGPWPDDPRYDPELLRHGDRRNVVDRYRYWRHEAIVRDLDSRRHEFHVAIENWQHDFNIGSVVRTANAFLAEAVHIVGRRRWNRRGAMVTDRYQHVHHHPDVDALGEWAAARDLPLLGIDNLPGACPLETYELPRRCVLLFGQEGPGLSEPARKRCDEVLSIAQYGSTRSINAGAAAAIAMHAWIRRHRFEGG